MKEKTKGEILKQKGTWMAEDGEVWNGLEMTILKTLANFFKMHEQWRSSFKKSYISNLLTHIEHETVYSVTTVTMVTKTEWPWWHSTA